LFTPAKWKNREASPAREYIDTDVAPVSAAVFISAEIFITVNARAGA